MRWTVNLTERWADVIRFAIKCAFGVNIILLAIFSIWFTALLLWRLLQFLWRSWLGHPW